MGKHITIVAADDWEGVYIDGELVHQENSIDISRMLEILQNGKMLADGVTVSGEPASPPVFAENNNRLPKNLHDVVKWGQGKRAFESKDGMVHVYVDGKLMAKLHKDTYDLIKEVTTVIKEQNR